MRHGGRGQVLVAGVRSRTHLVYAASWLRERARTTGEKPAVGVLPTGMFLGQSRVSHTDTHQALDDVAHHIDTDVRHQWIRSAGPDVALLCVGAPALRLVAPLVRATRHMPHIVVIDEGLGTYGDTRTRAAAYRRNGSGAGWAALRASAVATGRRLLTSEAWLTYRQSPSGWQVEERIAGEFQRRLSGSAPPPRTAVLLTQPWPQLGVLSDEAYRDHLGKVADSCSEAGLDLVLRVHPADSPERYGGFRLAPGGVPAEMDRAVIGARVVLGASSTALLNLAAFYGTRCLRVRPKELAALDQQLGSRQASLLDHFLPAPVPPQGLTERALLE